MKRILTAVLCSILISNMLAVPAAADDVYTAPVLNADAAILINGNSGEILYDKNRLKEEFPASTTKIMTALVVLDEMKLNDEVIVSKHAASVGGATVNLIEGEKLTIEQLLYGMMLNSANDAAVALAEATAGDLDSFAWKMNKKATDLGGISTYFLTPNGLPNDAHVTSAYDLAIYTKAAMENKTFRKIVSSAKYNIPATNKSAPRELHNTNKLLFDNTEVNVNGKTRPIKYEDVIGVKTGFTNAAQGCLVAAYKNKDTYLIGVVMHSTVDTLYPDMISLLDFGRNGYKTVTILKAGDVAGKVKVRRGSKSYVDVMVKEDVTASIEMGPNGAEEDYSAYSYKVTTDSIQAPQKAGFECGELILLHDEKEVGYYDLFTAEDAELSKIYSIVDVGGGTKNILAVGLSFLIIFAAIYLGAIAYIRYKDKKQKAERIRLRKEREFFFENLHIDPNENENSENSELITSENMMPEGLIDESFVVFDDITRKGTEARRQQIEYAEKIAAEKEAAKMSKESANLEFKQEDSTPEERLAEIRKRFSEQMAERNRNKAQTESKDE